MERHRLSLDGRTYEVDILRRNRSRPDAVSIVQPSHNAKELTRISLESIRRYTTFPYELWVVDNASSDDTIEFLEAQDDVNLILNHTAPWKRRHFWERRKDWWQKSGGGSYANGVALELAAKFVETRYMFVMHNDTLVCKTGWLAYLVSKLDDKVRGAAMSHDPIRINAMHSSGFLFDFSLFRPLSMSFLPSPPHYDVADLVTIRLREAGYHYYVCKNTFNHPETIELIDPNDPLRDMYCDRVFDDNGTMIYLHLGRGTLKAAGIYNKLGKTYPGQWIRYAEEHLLS